MFALGISVAILRNFKCIQGSIFFAIFCVARLDPEKP